MFTVELAPLNSKCSSTASCFVGAISEHNVSFIHAYSLYEKIDVKEISDLPNGIKMMVIRESPAVSKDKDSGQGRPKRATVTRQARLAGISTAPDMKKLR
jgi:hypothetical protein